MSQTETPAKVEPNCFASSMAKRNRGRLRRNGKVSFDEVPGILSDLAECLSDLNPYSDEKITRSQVNHAIRELNSAGEDLSSIAELLQELIDNEIEFLRDAYPTPLDRMDAEYSAKFPWRVAAELSS